MNAQHPFFQASLSLSVALVLGGALAVASCGGGNDDAENGGVPLAGPGDEPPQAMGCTRVPLPASGTLSQTYECASTGDCNVCAAHGIRLTVVCGSATGTCTGTSMGTSTVKVECNGAQTCVGYTGASSSKTTVVCNDSTRVCKGGAIAPDARTVVHCHGATTCLGEALGAGAETSLYCESSPSCHCDGSRTISVPPIAVCGEGTLG